MNKQDSWELRQAVANMSGVAVSTVGYSASVKDTLPCPDTPCLWNLEVVLAAGNINRKWKS